MKYFGYINSKINRLIGTTSGGEWKQISYIKYLWLKINNYIVKKHSE